jgi:hypothetical protein
MEYHFLGIAINDYPNIPDMSLQGPVHDVHAVADVLSSSYDFDHITILQSPSKDPERLANLKNIANHIESIQGLGEDSSLIIYYAGHGRYKKRSKSGYWLASDTQYDSGFEGGPGWYHHAVLLGIIENSSAPRHILLISDSCFAGSLIKRDMCENNLRRDIHEVIDGYRSREVLTSCGLNSDGTYQVADDSRLGGHSLFASWLLEYLKHPPRDIFYTNDLFTYLRNAIGKMQMPALGDLEGHDKQRNATFVFRKKQIPVEHASNKQKKNMQTVITPVSPTDKTVDWDTLYKEYTQIVIEGSSFATLIHRHPELIKIVDIKCKDSPMQLLFKALAYDHGFFNKKSAKQIVNMYRAAAEAKDSVGAAWYHIGKAYEQGRGVEKDTKQAFDAYKKAYESGFLPALYSLGLLMASGEVGSQEVTEGIHYIEKAAGQGCVLANRYMRRHPVIETQIGSPALTLKFSEPITDEHLQKRIDAFHKRINAIGHF